MGHDNKILRLGYVTEKKHEQQALQTKVRSYRESINSLFFRHPFELQKIDIDAVRNLSKELIACLEDYKMLQREIEELEE